MPSALEFGSRSGSWFALVFFSGIFGLLAWGIASEIRRRSSGPHPAFAPTLGALFFIVPVAMVYWSMLSGFYEVEFHGASMRLHYLFPGVVVEAPIAHSRSTTQPAYRDRIRLVVRTDYGVYESTPWRRDEVMASLDRLNERVRGR